MLKRRGGTSTTSPLRASPTTPCETVPYSLSNVPSEEFFPPYFAADDLLRNSSSPARNKNNNNNNNNSCYYYAVDDEQLTSSPSNAVFNDGALVFPGSGTVGSDGDDGKKNDGSVLRRLHDFFQAVCFRNTPATSPSRDTESSNNNRRSSNQRKVFYPQASPTRGNALAQSKKAADVLPVPLPFNARGSRVHVLRRLWRGLQKWMRERRLNANLTQTRNNNININNVVSAYDGLGGVGYFLSGALAAQGGGERFSSNNNDTSSNSSRNTSNNRTRRLRRLLRWGLCAVVLLVLLFRLVSYTVSSSWSSWQAPLPPLPLHINAEPQAVVVQHDGAVRRLRLPVSQRVRATALPSWTLRVLTGEDEESSVEDDAGAEKDKPTNAALRPWEGSAWSSALHCAAVGLEGEAYMDEKPNMSFSKSSGAAHIEKGEAGYRTAASTFHLTGGTSSTASTTSAARRTAKAHAVLDRKGPYAVFATAAAALGSVGPFLLALRSVTDDVDVQRELPQWTWLTTRTATHHRPSALRSSADAAPPPHQRSTVTTASSTAQTTTQRGGRPHYVAVMGILSTDGPLPAQRRNAQRATWMAHRGVAQHETSFDGSLLPLYVFAASTARHAKGNTAHQTTFVAGGRDTKRRAEDEKEEEEAARLRSAGKASTVDSWVFLPTVWEFSDATEFYKAWDKNNNHLRTTHLGRAHDGKNSSATTHFSKGSSAVDTTAHVYSRRSYEHRRMSLRPNWQNSSGSTSDVWSSPCSHVITKTVHDYPDGAAPSTPTLEVLRAYLHLPVTPAFTSSAQFICGASAALWQEALEHKNAIWIDMELDRHVASAGPRFRAGQRDLAAEVGMSQKLILWLSYAYHAFPDVPFLLKGDDDTYLKVPQFLSDMDFVLRGRTSRGESANNNSTNDDVAGEAKREVYLQNREDVIDTAVATILSTQGDTEQKENRMNEPRLIHNTASFADEKRVVANSAKPDVTFASVNGGAEVKEVASPNASLALSECVYWGQLRGPTNGPLYFDSSFYLLSRRLAQVFLEPPAAAAAAAAAGKTLTEAAGTRRVEATSVASGSAASAGAAVNLADLVLLDVAPPLRPHYRWAGMDTADTFVGKVLANRRGRASVACPHHRILYIAEGTPRFHALSSHPPHSFRQRHRPRDGANSRSRRSSSSSSISNNVNSVVTWASTVLHGCSVSDMHFLDHFFRQEHQLNVTSDASFREHLTAARAAAEETAQAAGAAWAARALFYNCKERGLCAEAVGGELPRVQWVAHGASVRHQKAKVVNVVDGVAVYDVAFRAWRTEQRAVDGLMTVPHTKKAVDTHVLLE